jgi:chromosome segregation ATPase
MNKINDPYYQNQSFVNAKLKSFPNQIKQLEQFFLESPNHDCIASEVEKSISELRQDITKLNHIIYDLSKANEIAKQNRNSFIHLDDLELKNRQQYVANTLETLKNFDEIVNRYDKNLESIRKRALMTTNNVKDAASVAISVSQNRQQMVYQEQDEVLDTLAESLKRLEHTTVAINQELKEQDGHLNDLDEDIDAAHGQLNMLLSKMRNLIKPKKGFCGQLCCIFILLGLIFLLLFLIVF